MPKSQQRLLNYWCDPLPNNHEKAGCELSSKDLILQLDGHVKAQACYQTEIKRVNRVLGRTEPSSSNAWRALIKPSRAHIMPSRAQAEGVMSSCLLSLLSVLSVTHNDTLVSIPA